MIQSIDFNSNQNFYGKRRQCANHVVKLLAQNKKDSAQLLANNKKLTTPTVHIITKKRLRVDSLEKQFAKKFYCTELFKALLT